MHYLAASLTTGAQLKDWILTVGGNVLAGLFAIRAIGYLIKDEYGKLITFGVAAVFVGALVWAPDTVVPVLTGVWDKVRGA